MEFRKEKIAVLQLPAGIDAQGNPVLENVEAYVLDKADHYELMKSPLFVRNLSRGDIFHVTRDNPGALRVVRRSGMVAVRIFSPEGIDLLEQRLTPAVEKLDGSLDIHTDRALAYSLHVNIGFNGIETLFDGVMADFPGTVWYYGNIYDPGDGVTPLNWWDSFINQV